MGEPLRFSVRGADKTLLLAAGQVIHDDDQLNELFDRGAMVEAAEVAASLRAQGGATDASAQRVSRIARASIEQLPGLWDDCATAVQAALCSEQAVQAAAISSAAGQLLALLHRSPEVAMSQVVRQHGGSAAHYGVSHSMNAATACLMTARTLNWSVDDQQRVFHAALTMNLSMVELQGRLAHQVSPLTTNQRKAIQDHPRLSAELLEQAGIDDADWLAAVREHHEVPDGSGYPAGSTELSEMGQLLRYADVYTALMSRRATRAAMSAREAGRELYQMASESPLCHAVIKAFGVFPPGSYVRLASGEVGVVTRNGDKAYHPRVAALTTTDGQLRKVPALRDTAIEQHAVTALLSDEAMPVRVSAQTLTAAIAAA
jgi:HD-GYP domain-containing protein (c-di-GMP phosphodiesterase class II)